MNATGYPCRVEDWPAGKEYKGEPKLKNGYTGFLEFGFTARPRGLGIHNRNFQNLSAYARGQSLLQISSN